MLLPQDFCGFPKPGTAGVSPLLWHESHLPSFLAPILLLFYFHSLHSPIISLSSLFMLSSSRSGWIAIVYETVHLFLHTQASHSNYVICKVKAAS